MAGVGFVAAPTLFAVLERATAGHAAAQLFATDAAIGLGFGGLLLVATLQKARIEAEAGVGSRFSTEMLLALAALFCVVAGHYGVQPMLEAARRGEGGASFGALHAASTVFFGLRFLAASVLAWWLTGPSRVAGKPS